jgi:hypothetical protein
VASTDIEASGGTNGGFTVGTGWRGGGDVASATGGERCLRGGLPNDGKEMMRRPVT